MAELSLNYLYKPIYRFEVPVDDQWHEHRCGPVLHVAARKHDVVEFWAQPDHDFYEFLVVGTGHETPGDVTYCGTALAPGQLLVWHLLKRGYYGTGRATGSIEG